MGNCLPPLFSGDPERAKRRLQSTQLYSHQQNDMIAEFDNGIMKEALTELEKLIADRISVLEYAKKLTLAQATGEDDEDLDADLDPHVVAQLEGLLLKVKLLEPQIKHAKNHVIQLQARRQLVIERKRMAAREGTFGAMLDMGPDQTKASQKVARLNADKAAKVRDGLEEEDDLTHEYAVEQVDTPQADLLAEAAQQEAVSLMRKARERVLRTKAQQAKAQSVNKKRSEGEEQPPGVVTLPSVPTRPIVIHSSMSNKSSDRGGILALRTS